jgi:hypothetical protein
VTPWYHGRIKIIKANSKKVTRARFSASVTAYHSMCEGNKIEMGNKFFVPTLLALCTAFFLLGCAIMGSKDKAFDEEKLLVSADFTYKVADTAAKLEKLNRLPQRKMLRHVRQGKATYLYVDVAACKCVYMGDEAAFQRLRHLEHENKLEDKQIEGLWSATIDREGLGLGGSGYAADIGDDDFPDFD